MMKNLLFLLFVSTSVSIFSQKITIDSTSIQNNSKKEVRFSKIRYRKVKKQTPYDALAPSRASFYSAIIPGLGQAYSGKYWKISIIYAALGTSVGIALWNQKYYKLYRDAYKDRTLGIYEDDFIQYSNENLISAQETRQKNKEISILVSVGLYVLNIIDANVTAHLQQFNLNNELSFEPNINFDVQNSTNYGLSLHYNF